MAMQSGQMSILEILASSIVKMGPMPEHIAIIMDGNRRYARRNGLKVLFGHLKGAETLADVDRFAKALLCKELTVYAFSSENFRRNKEEVTNLMNVIEHNCTKMLQRVDSGTNIDTCIQFIGDWENCPDSLRYRMANLMVKTRNFKPYQLNVAIVYTGREGILRSLTSLPVSIKNQENVNLHSHLNPCEWNEYLVEQSQHLSDMRPVDMLIRTGGDCRLSDFMMWETTQAYIHFTPETWPEFTFWRLLHAILMYQVHRRTVPKPVSSKENISKIEVDALQGILRNARNERWKRIEQQAMKDTPYEKIEKVIKYENKFLQVVQNLTIF
ncbi:dehydrodolichyl diphosphate synthase complex subunit DHDDS [Folsomia candida]|uniref:Alkyl transferase n=1 Tax=Folsomia candida TaxID=158441 RepID=A0A226EP13_FOLCA|nr:dehydrodolichyl diphosphate synthase complex subunit DHDDS [Folsomia candida]OXA59239.1 Dehydrodolichyl diphosphate syntase complex subunit DHDDS [Folsomia candida]